MNEQINTDTQTHQLTAIPTVKRERKRLVKRYPGVLSDVAKKIGCRAATVVNVWALRAGSSKIETALLEEFNRRIELQQMKQDAENAA